MNQISFVIQSKYNSFHIIITCIFFFFFFFFFFFSEIGHESIVNVEGLPDSVVRGSSNSHRNPNLY